MVEQGTTIHELKTWPPYYGEIACGRKTFDCRLNDRGFQMLDTLVLKEWLPAKYEEERTKFLALGYTKAEAEFEAEAAAYTGRSVTKRIGYILYGGDPAIVGMEASHAGISTGYVVLSLIPTAEQAANLRRAWEDILPLKREAAGLPRNLGEYLDTRDEAGAALWEGIRAGDKTK